MAEPGLRSIGELRQQLLARSLGAEELVRSTLDAIAAAEALGAFVSTAGDDLLSQAAAVDRALDDGQQVGPLAGIPVAVKDNICTSDLPTTCGSKILDGFVSPYEASAVRRLRSAGALIVGKTNLDEFAMGSSTENSAFGPTRNPHDPERVPGGSSGGSFCGVVGLKPSYGRVSRYGLVAFASSLDQIGVIAGNVADSARVLSVIAGVDRFDSTSVDTAVPDFDRDIEVGVAGRVIGLPREYFPVDLDGDVADSCRAAVERLRDLGAEVREISLPHTRFAIPTYYLIANAEASSNLARYDGVRYGLRAREADSTLAVYRDSRGEGFGREVKRRIVLGTYGLSAGYYEAYYGRAQRVRRLITEDFEHAFAAGVDAVLTPTSPTTAFRLGERVDDPVRMYLADVFTATANLARLPAISLPIGASDGLPVGGQIIGRSFDEGRMLQVAYALEQSLQ
jgi:aspartyl-tRNA(Asn)/glutamyl-tRNA(Gln) amidotransferase subunit A